MDRGTRTVYRRLIMKYTMEERLEIGKRIYDGEINRFEAALEYGINELTARSYMRLYKTANGLPPKNPGKRGEKKHPQLKPIQKDPALEEYESMSKEELIQELVRSRIREARLKKGYEVKGDGAEKIFVPLSNKNTRSSSN